ncbi:hypothetical protein MTP09_12825 [Chryseobacterium suipulveris]|uniref:Uncharacterized protein n=1 Tax=Chryseobacterium suipulveris TaxID=2929800 RepID=A0ABY4BNL2_9FLAO|nr:hypothetical protein [Chryseobacterium suipulveris]UOE40774.1 hypothetical protein MTP09_12825 [Chryseobacterium suipulveris]
MKIKETKIKTLQASIFIGLEYGYTQKQIDENLVIESLSELQKQLSKEKDIYLSASVSKTVIVLNNQKEPHLKIDFINYPKFPLDENIFKDEVLIIGKELMKQFKQNRILIIYTDETVMLEQSEETDTRIKIK